MRRGTGSTWKLYPFGLWASPDTPRLPATVELGEERFEVERHSRHRQLTAHGGPLLSGSVAVQLDAVAVRITQVECLANAVIRRSADAHAVVDQAAERVRELAPTREGDCDVV